MAHNLSKSWSVTLVDAVEQIIANPAEAAPQKGPAVNSPGSSGLDISRVDRITVLCQNNHGSGNVTFNVLVGPGQKNSVTGVRDYFDVSYTVVVGGGDIGIIDILRYHPHIRIVGTPAGSGNYPVVVYFDGYIRTS